MQQIGRIVRRAGEGDVHPACAQQPKHLIAAAADDADVDVGIGAVERLQMRQEKLACYGVARADNERAGLQRAGLLKLVLARFQQPHGAADIFKEQAAVFGEGNAARRAYKQARAKLLLELLDALADGGLGEKQILGGERDVAGLGDLAEYAVKLQLDHGGTSFFDISERNNNYTKTVFYL